MTREEAIEIVKTQYSHDAVMKTALGVLIPELYESEDERIRKRLIQSVKVLNNQWLSLYGLTKSSVLAWLEKLKEQKPAEQVEINKSLTDAVIAELSKYNGENSRKSSWAIDSTGLQYPLHFANLGAMWQKEQKPNYCHHEVDETGWTEEYRKAYYDGWNNCNMQHEQLKADHKPAEWSEEDEKMLWSAINGLNIHIYEKERAWLANKLKSLRPQPKQEWSEEDEKKILFLERLIKYHVPEGRYGYIDKSVTKLQAITMLKSLHPFWKPSEEQMKELKEASAIMKCDSDDNAFPSLKTLYEQLEKL